MAAAKPIAEGEQSGDAFLLKIGGVWRLTGELPNADRIMEQNGGTQPVRIVPEKLEEWDSSLPLFLLQINSWCRTHGAKLILDELPNALKKLFRLIQQSEQQAPQVKSKHHKEFEPLAPIRRWAAELRSLAEFIGGFIISVFSAPANPRQARWKQVFREMMATGPQAFFVVALLGFLVGIVFTYETIQQLQRFGAPEFAVKGLGPAVVRQMAPVLAAVIVAGRTGAAFSAQIANMKLAGEIDALEVLGISPMNFLVWPRVTALFWMMPMLILYADLFGILGGLVVILAQLHIPQTEFWVQFEHSIMVTDVMTGLVKAAVFGMLIAMAGTYCGLTCERSSEGVGRAATSAVVASITAIIAANTVLSPLLDKLG